MSIRGKDLCMRRLYGTDAIILLTPELSTPNVADTFFFQTYLCIHPWSNISIVPEMNTTAPGARRRYFPSGPLRLFSFGWTPENLFSSSGACVLRHNTSFPRCL